MFSNKLFTRDNIDLFLKELGKEFKKIGRGAHAEIIIVGGASIILNYCFRMTSYDIDAIYTPKSALKEAINKVGDLFNLPNGWLNDNFKTTSSYSPKIIEFSKYYKTFSGVLSVRTINDEYLIAMKLMSGREYKKDISDIIGILNERKLAGFPINFENIDKAILDLYGTWDLISDYAKNKINIILQNDNLKDLFEQTIDEELINRDILTNIVNKYPKLVNEDNVDDILKKVNDKKKKNL